MTRPSVRMIDTGVANSASVIAAFERLGADIALTLDPADVDRAPLLVLPGVGAFSAGMRRLNDSGLVEPLRQRLRDDRPTLAICLGLQLLCASSEESPNVSGLSVIPQTVHRFPPSVRTPQFGWNEVAPDDASRFITRGFAYFANSYRLTETPAGWTPAFADHGGGFIAAMERGAALACQFHPELSGDWGQAILQRWLAACSTEAALC